MGTEAKCWVSSAVVVPVCCPVCSNAFLEDGDKLGVRWPQLGLNRADVQWCPEKGFVKCVHSSS